MESYRTEEEQVEALRRWWNENGRSTIVAIIVALGVGFGWQGWKQYNQGQRESASNAYQSMLQAFNTPALSGEQLKVAVQLAEQIKADYSASTYAQFAALQLARVAIDGNNLAEAEAQLRWVLGRADKGSDVARTAQLRLARVLASSGEPDQALAILEQVDEGPYRASYAIARGDILLSLGRDDEAREAYTTARMLVADEQSQVNLAMLEQKLQALNPVPLSVVTAKAAEQATATAADAATETGPDPQAAATADGGEE